MHIDPRFLKEAGREVFTGNELLVKGALETVGGVHLITGYPGSPVAGFFDPLSEIGSLLNEKGMVAKLANNEALGAAMVNGSQMVGCRSIVAFKNVGLHVAADALALGVLAGTHEEGGVLVICGDDPWSESTQVPADSRFMAEHLRMPMIEPCSPQEVKDWIGLGFKLGQAGRIYVGYTVTVATADGGGTVECRPNHYPTVNEHQKVLLSYQEDIEPVLEQMVLLPPRSWRREIGMDQRLATVKAEARRLGINRILHRPQKDEIVPLGFIASGTGFAYLNHALVELGLAGRLPILKLGMTYPVDEQIVTEFAQRCRQIVVIEERRSFVERQVVEILSALRQSGEEVPEVYGKRFPESLPGIPATRGLNPSLLIKLLVPLLRQNESLPSELTNGRLTAEYDRIELTSGYEVKLPVRTPTFCPGCPHRDSANVLLELRRRFSDSSYMLTHHKRKPLDLVVHGETGCHTMLMFEPNKPLMHNYSGMGLGGGTGSGIDPFIQNKQLVPLGDSTFFHSGQLAISHAISSGQDITFLILDNKTTAMTGHQGHPGIEIDLTGKPMPAQEIERVVQGMIPKAQAKKARVIRTNPADRERYLRLLEQTILTDGVKVIIADKECGITAQRRERAAERKEARELGFLPRKTHMNVALEVCEYCLECTNMTGCPGLTVQDTDYGPKIQTDLSWCVNDKACQKINACPSFEEVTIIRKQPPRFRDEHVNLSDLPPPARPIHADQEEWRCFLAGVGGMGIGLCTAILVTAGNEMGYQVQFLDKKGLAIRNGGVCSQLVYTRMPAERSKSENGNGELTELTTPLISYGKADLLLGVDLLEAARALDPQQPYRIGSPSQTAAVINTAKTPTILTLMGREDFNPAEIEQVLRRYTDAERYFGFNLGDLCERMLRNKLYVNVMILGIAFQKGYLPLTLAAIRKAITNVTAHEVERNLRAFDIGRKIAVRPDLFVVEPTHEVESARKAFRRIVNSLRARTRGKRGRRLAKQYRILMKQTFRATRGLRVDDQLVRDVIVRTYDCLSWGGLEYARRYCRRLCETFEKDHPAHGYAMTRAVVWNLAKVMLIKDEVYVASLLTSPEKYKRDRRRFNVNPANGDRIIYRHHNRPEFTVFGRHFRFEWKSSDWQLRLMSRMRFLRGLMPAWHKAERQFRDWYEQLVDRMQWSGPGEYQRWLQVLRVPETVSGYREVRYPKMDAARRRAEQLLAASPGQFDGPPPPAERTISLPVVVTAAGMDPMGLRTTPIRS